MLGVATPTSTCPLNADGWRVLRARGPCSGRSGLLRPGQPLGGTLCCLQSAGGTKEGAEYSGSSGCSDLCENSRF